jgi:hypothetical protein
MRRALLACLALTALLAGCGGGKQAATTVVPPPAPPPPPPPATTAPGGPTVTSAADIAACSELARNLRVVSQMTANSTEVLATQSVHPKDLAKRVRDSQNVLLYAAKVMSLTDVPSSLTTTRARFVAAIRKFASDFGRARRAVLAGNMAAAASVLDDGPALQVLQASSRRIEKTCGA